MMKLKARMILQTADSSQISTSKVDIQSYILLLSVTHFVVYYRLSKMSTNLKYKQVVNVKRRTWDLDVYDQLAKEEAQQQDSGKIIKKKKRKHEKEGQSLSLPTLGPQGTDDNGEEQKEEFQRAAKGAAGPAKSERAFLKARRQRVDVDSKIGSVEMIHPDAAATTKANAGDEGGSVKVRI